MELRPEEVFKRILQLVAGASRLYALFATTHRTVSGIKPGTTQPKSGLLIDVRSGIIDDYSRLVGALLLGRLGGDDLATAGRLIVAGAQMMDAEGQAAQATVDQDTSELVIPEGYQFLAVCYTGITAFQPALQNVSRMKSRVPGSKVVLVTYDCDMAWKRFYLQPHLDNGEIDMLIVTSYHGGEKTMRDILDALVNFWPGTSAA